MGYSGGGGGGGGGSGGSGGSGGGYGGAGGGTGYGGSNEFELPSYNQAPPGSIRFNTDSKKLEVYILGSVGVGTLPNGIWMEVDSWSPELMTGGTRGILSGGNPVLATQDLVNIDTTGNATNFGDMTKGRGQHVCCASRTRGFNAGGFAPTTVADYEILTIASTGSAVAANNLGAACDYGAGLSNSTRGIFAGFSTTDDRIEYLTMASLGNAIDFGNLTDGRNAASSCQSSTRGLVIGGQSGPSPGLGIVNIIDLITISTLGNTADFGDLANPREQGATSSNSVRAIIAGGESPVSNARTNSMEFVTIATLGNSQDFGDLTQARNQIGGVASPTRGVFYGGVNPSPTPGQQFDIIDYVQIMSLGDAVDFGDLQNARRRNPPQGISNGHGGL